MKRSLFVLAFCSLLLVPAMAQNIPMPLNYTKVYDFVDELLTDGVIVHQTAVRPYSRMQIAQMLVEAQSRDSLLNKRQRDDLKFYLNVFALEREECSDDADSDDEQAHHGNAARVQNVAPENGGGIDEACVC